MRVGRGDIAAQWEQPRSGPVPLERLGDDVSPVLLERLRRDLEGLYPTLHMVGRNGMHRYNNQDHSMLTAKAAVEAIASGRPDKDSIWSINVDDEYHEAK